MFTIFLRALILYAITIIALRALGKSQLGQFQPYELALALLLADLMATPMSDASTPLLHGALPAAALFVAHSVLTFLSMRSDKLRQLISGKPSVVVTDGVIDRAELTRLCLSLPELIEGMRQQGIPDPAALGTAIVEANGNLSAFQKDETCGFPVIMDGRVQDANLSITPIDASQLTTILDRYNLDAKGVLLMSVDALGAAHIQTMDGAVIHTAEGQVNSPCAQN